MLLHVFEYFGIKLLSITKNNYTYYQSINTSQSLKYTLLFAVADDCVVVIKVVGDLRVGDVLLELLFLRLLLFLLGEVLLFLEEGDFLNTS